MVGLNMPPSHSWWCEALRRPACSPSTFTSAAKILRTRFTVRGAKTAWVCVCTWHSPSDSTTALPPSATIASRIAARSTTAGTPGKSCSTTRAGWYAISTGGVAAASHPASPRPCALSFLVVPAQSPGVRSLRLPEMAWRVAFAAVVGRAGFPAELDERTKCTRPARIVQVADIRGRVMLGKPFRS